MSTLYYLKAISSDSDSVGFPEREMPKPTASSGPRVLRSVIFRRRVRRGGRWPSSGRRRRRRRRRVVVTARISLQLRTSTFMQRMAATGLHRARRADRAGHDVESYTSVHSRVTAASRPNGASGARACDAKATDRLRANETAFPPLVKGRCNIAVGRDIRGRHDHTGAPPPQREFPRYPLFEMRLIVGAN